MPHPGEKCLTEFELFFQSLAEPGPRVNPEHFEEERRFDHGFFSGLAADFCSSSVEQLLEVLPLAERVEGRLGPEAEASR